VELFLPVTFSRLPHLCHSAKLPVLKNCLTAEFNNNELKLLQLGPSYVCAPRKLSNTEIIRTKANIHACYDRCVSAINKGAIMHEADVIHFLNKAKEVVMAENSSLKVSRESQIEEAALKSLLTKPDVLITKTDKTNRLLAINKESYSSSLKQSLGSLASSKTVKPASTQKKFNKDLMEVAKKYPGEIYQMLSQCTCSEPLPKQPYGLPKDHKDGALKFRPIVSSFNAASRKLSICMAKVLKPLLALIPAHLESTKQFLEVLPNSLPQDSYFGSLDVKNLYGSIPLTTSTSTPSVFEVVSSFFSDNNKHTLLSGMHKADFCILLNLCLNFDTIYLNHNTFRQNLGIPMGNNIAPILAIIYMHNLEQQLVHKIGTSLHLLVRYIDDIFFIADKSLTIDSFINTANSINSAIQFTFELPNENNTLPFLDVSVSYNPSLSTELFIKPIHSNSILNFKSHVPKSRKINLVKSEMLRAKICSNTDSNGHRSKNKVLSRFLANGYPCDFLSKYSHNDNANEGQKFNDMITFLKLPYQTEKTVWKIKKTLKSSGLNDKIHLIFTSRPPLHRILSINKESVDCAVDCLSCTLALKPGQCNSKNIVYKITCLLCANFVYIGETMRRVGTRITEHALTDKQSLVYQHMRRIHPLDTNKFQWQVLMRIDNWYTRTAAESLLSEENNLTHKVRELNRAILH